MVFGRIRKDEMEDADTYTLWAIDGEDIHRDHPTVRTDDTLEGFAPVNMAQLASEIDEKFTDATFPKTSFNAALLDIKAAKQRTEVKLMLAYEQATGGSLTFPTGNQTQVDAIDAGGRKLQFKTYRLSSLFAEMSTRDKGVTKAYWQDASFDAIVIGVVVEKPDGRYLLYCEFSKDALNERGMLRRHATETEEATSGCMSLSPPLGLHAQWLLGRELKSRFQSSWMAGCWRGPTKLEDTDRLPHSFG